MERKKATYGSRMGAFIVDIFLIVILFFFFELAVCRTTIGNLSVVKDNLATYNYYEGEFAKIQDEYEIYIYDEDGKRLYNEKLTEETKTAFESDERVVKIREEIEPYAKNVVTYATIEYAIALFLSSFIALFVIPLIAKEGRTLGKFLLKVAVRNADDSDIRWHKLLLRWFVQLVLEIVIGLVTLLAIPLISLVCTTFTKDNKSLVDLICKTKVIQDLPVPRTKQN